MLCLYLAPPPCKHSHSKGLDVFYNKRLGFTLAEVLITLTIIGIIAAMTIPTLMSKYQEKAMESQFKKTYAMINQSLALNSNYECYIDEANMWGTDGRPQSECPEFWDNVTSNLKVVKNEKVVRIVDGNIHSDGASFPYKTPNEVRAAGGTVSDSVTFPINSEDTLRKYTLADGSTLFINSSSYYLNDSALFITFDVNGDKGPNKWGYDVFQFYILKKLGGTIKLSDSSYYKILEKGGKSSNDIILGTKN